MSTEQTPVNVLRRARTAISGPGCWCKFALHGGGGSHCADGALRLASRSDASLLVAARKLLSDPLEIRTTRGLWEWNDDHIRTHAQVLAAFDRAIALAETSPS